MDLRMPTWAAPAISAAPRTPHAHPKAMAFRLPNLSLVTPTDALPSHANAPSASVPVRKQGNRECRTSTLINRHDGTPERRIGLVEVCVERGQGETGCDDAGVTGGRNCQRLRWVDTLMGFGNALAVEKPSYPQEYRGQEGPGQPLWSSRHGGGWE